MIYVFDLDGTLCETDGMDYADARPLLGRIGIVNGLYLAGHTIVIDTARGSGSGIDWHGETTWQLARWGVRYHELRCGKKAVGDVYVDDRAENAAAFFEKARRTHAR